MKSDYHLTKEDADNFKLFFDYLKHLTTLNSGAILVILTLAEKFFSDSASKGLLFVSLGSFIVSILASLLTMALVPLAVGMGAFTKRLTSVFTTAFAVSGCTFLFGMLIIVLVLFKYYG